MRFPNEILSTIQVIPSGFIRFAYYFIVVSAAGDGDDKTMEKVLIFEK